MPTKKTFTKESIINVCIEIIREEGYQALSIRNVAKRMNSSIQPIFYTFKSFDNLKNEVGEACFLICNNFIYDSFKFEDKPYLSIGLNFLRFANEEKNIFKFLFDNKDLDFEKLTSYNKYFKNVVSTVSNTVNADRKISTSIHNIVGISAIGLAILIANNRIIYDEENAIEFLSLVFKGQVLCQKGDEDEYNRDQKFKEILQRHSGSK